MNYFNQLSSHQWEIFAGYYIKSIGYDILEPPSIGPDGGKDLLVEKAGIRYLVSCKHKSVGGRNVTEDIETSISDRLTQHGAEKFIGFYSGKCSQKLKSSLRNQEIDFLILEGDEIIDNLDNISFSVHQALFNKVRPIKRKIFSQPYLPLHCCCGCDADLLESGNITKSLIFLVPDVNGLKLIFEIDGHTGVTDRMGERRVVDCISLTGLNDMIDAHEVIIQSFACKNPSLSRDYCVFFEGINQVINPSD